VRYLGIEVDDALEIAEQTEIWPRRETGGLLDRRSEGDAIGGLPVSSALVA